MFVRADDLAAALRFIASGSCVSIVGPDGSGRSVLLREIAGSLEQRGYTTIRIVGVEALRRVPLGALDLAGEVAKPSPTLAVGQVVAAIAEHVVDRRCVMLVDDAEFVDEESWGAVAAVHARTGAVIVTTSSSAVDGGANRLHAIASQAAELRLRPISFEAVSDLIHEQLGGAVDTGLVGRVYTRSAGIPSLAVAMTTAAQAYGHIVRTDDIWTTNGELWHDAMSGAVEHLLAPLDPTQLEAVETLALAGVLDIDTASELVGRELIETLEASGLLLSIEPFGRLSVAVTPPLIADYFQNRPTSSRRSRILNRIQNQFGADGPDPSAAGLVPPAGLDSSLEPDAAEMSVIRLIRDRHAAQLSARRRAWERDPHAAAAIEYLFVLFDQRHDPDTALRVFERTDTTGGDARALAMFRIFQARWYALAAGDVAEARHLLTTAAREQPRYRTMFDVWSTQLEIGIEGTRPEHVQRLAALTGRDATTESSILAVLVTALILRGHAPAAMEKLAGSDDTSTKLGRVLALLRGWAMFGSGAVRDAYEWAVVHIEQSRVELDLENLRGHTYLAAVSGIVLGRFRTAELHLGRFLALGEPGLGQEGTRMGALALAALLAVRAGRHGTAESLASQALTTGVRIGPWPGMVAALPEIVSALLAGESRRAEELLHEQIVLLRARGYLLAAATLRIITTGLGASTIPRTTEDPELGGLDGTLVTPVFDLQKAILDENPADLRRLGAWFEGEGRVEHALIAFTHGRDAAARHGDQAAVDVLSSDLANLHARRDPLDLLPRAGRGDAQKRLSTRELEVARLAAHGQSNQEIAELLHISPRTVESHLLKAFRKLQISARAELAAFSWA
ncbi:LuxR C-terminal-related transcriptional regulator [Microbacterium sp. NPDC087591]|uniref:LuxR C-terminal-related transcriptional regulator n=1 Tax=Microbacterium sp. NPDC087591 TaxID=3364192 RepID=UPI0037F95A27